MYTCLLYITDIDECDAVLSRCSQSCNNTEGSFQCLCYDGYQLQQDLTTCEGKRSNSAVIYSSRLAVRVAGTNDTFLK